jgi:hypothetical protein
MIPDGSLVVTNDVVSLMKEIAQLAEQCSDVYMFTDNPTVIGRIPNPTPYIETWMSDLFKGQRSQKLIVIDGSREHALSVKPQHMFELIGWLPQLHSHMVCVCPSGGELPEWAFQLVHLSEVQYLHGLVSHLGHPVVHRHGCSAELGMNNP